VSRSSTTLTDACAHITDHALSINQSQHQCATDRISFHLSDW